MRKESDIISRRYQINKELGRAVVIVKLAPSLGREPVVTVKTKDVREWLESQEPIKLGAAIQGGSFNNNMSRRLGSKKTAEDLQMMYVFNIVEEPVQAVEVKEEKPAPKKTTRRKASTTTKAKTTTAKATTTVKKEEAETEVKKTTTRRRRRKATTTKTEAKSESTTTTSVEVENGETK